MKKTTVLAGLGILGVGLVGTSVLYARNGLPQGRPSSAPQAAEASASGQRGALLGSGVAAEGRVVAYPGAEVHAGFERAGRLVSVKVQEGDLVRKGALLAELESDELRATLAEARARVAEAEAEVKLAEANGERRQRLFEEKILAVNDLDQANRDLDTARARRETALATVARYEAQLRKTQVRAPLAGTVTDRRVDAGQTVEEGAPAFTIADLTRLRIEGEAHEADAAVIALGAGVRITADGFPGQSWRGRVEEIPDSVTLRRLKPQDPSRPTDTRILAVKVAFAEKTPLRLGTTVELAIEPVRRAAR